MSLYRPGIDEINVDKVVASYNRWLEEVQEVDSENQETPGSDSSQLPVASCQREEAKFPFYPGLKN
jgi:hypothetical protein